MKKISNLIKSRNGLKRLLIDKKSIFYIFDKIIEREYGRRGCANLAPNFLKNKKLFVKAKNSVWANELWLNQQEFIEKLNQEIGSPEIDEIKIKN